MSGYVGKRGSMGQLGYDENSRVGAGTSHVWLFTQSRETVGFLGGIHVARTGFEETPPGCTMGKGL